MDGVAWQREGRAAVQQGWYPAGLSAPCALCEPQCRASPPLLLPGPTSKASLPALITHSVLLQAAIALVPKRSCKNLKKNLGWGLLVSNSAQLCELRDARRGSSSRRWKRRKIQQFTRSEFMILSFYNLSRTPQQTFLPLSFLVN